MNYMHKYYGGEIERIERAANLANEATPIKPSEDVMDQEDTIRLSDMGKCEKQKQARLMRQYD